MNTINNLLSNLNLDLDFTNNHESEKNDASSQNDINAHQNDIQLPSLSQGYKFKEYQNQIYENTEKKININMDGSITKSKKTKEGFRGPDPNSIKTVREEYNKTLSEYNNLLESISKSISSNIERNSAVNPYLNKLIRFSDSGAIYYVTKKGVAKYIPTPTILNSIAGKNGCPNMSYINLTIPWSYKYKIPGETIPTIPPLIVGTEMQTGASCGNEGSNVYVSNMVPNEIIQNITYKGCYQDNTNNPAMTFIGDPPSTSTKGKYGFDQCKMSAIDRGYQYFALQNADPTTGLGYCAVSNDLTASSKYGTAYKSIILWSSNTAGKPVSYAVLKNNGTLNVCDSTGKSYFTTPNGTECKIDNAFNYAAPLINRDVPGNDLGYYPNQSVTSCQKICDSKPNCGGIVVGFSNIFDALSNRSNNLPCWPKSGNLSTVTNFGPRLLYKKTSLKYNNAVNCNYFLNLQNDGNMSIYRGEPNTKNTVLIWSPNTTGKQQESNSNYSLVKSKYGMTFLKNDQVLNKGDWVVSADGKLVLIMQNDGNLVLMTFQSNCTTTFKNNSNRYVGGVSTNAVYDISSKGFLSDMGSIGYIDPNDELQIYPNSNTKYTNTYNFALDNTSINGNDIPGATFTNAKGLPVVCEEACNKLDKCTGFVFDTTGPTPVCIPKSNTSYYGNKDLQSKAGNITFIRDKTNITPAGLPNVNIDSITYHNYTKYKPNNLNFDRSLTLLTSVQKKQLEQLETRLKQLSDQMNGNTSNLLNIHNKIQSDTEKNNKIFNSNIKDVYSTNHQIKNFDLNNNIDNMLKEKEIKTLQENYSYMFWSIIAITTVLVAINIKK